ncbi:hypothetical protein JTE90_004147 [Oedothorax gibbosus]|uniref:Uncharacterized protein n=1 Tax=Oedothorax gibbosus TaxID=931172 RepID=A0AAV6TF78_9ARAC|nr:hypothetical protein JTE90_004147 [Oedothorax gibbosus]
MIGPVFASVLYENKDQASFCPFLYRGFFPLVNRAHRTPQADAVLYGTASYLRRGDSGTRIYKEKINSSPGPPRRLRVGCVTALVPKDLYPVRVGNLTPFPRSAARQTRACVCVRQDVSLRNGFLRYLRTT